MFGNSALSKDQPRIKYIWQWALQLDHLDLVRDWKPHLKVLTDVCFRTGLNNDLIRA